MGFTLTKDLTAPFMRLAVLRVFFAAVAGVATPVQAISASDVTAVVQVSPGTFEIDTASTWTRLSFLQTDVIHIHTIPINQNFSAPDFPIAVQSSFSQTGIEEIAFSQNASSAVFSTEAHDIVVRKKPMTLSINCKTQAVPGTILREVWPINIDVSGGTTTQYISQDADEQIFGGGIQAGYFNHKQRTIQISVNASDTAITPASFFMSSNGYAIFRNTYAPGIYSFQSQVTALQHSDKEYNAYVFLDASGQRSLKSLISAYTALTGRPDLPPQSAFELGDARCATAVSTTNATSGGTSILQGYKANNVSLSWAIANDDGGAGCALSDASFARFAADAASANVSAGLVLPPARPPPSFSGSPIARLNMSPNISAELDLQACVQLHDGIETNTSSRPLVLLNSGWSGIQRCAIPLARRPNATFAALELQIPTIQGAGLGGFSLFATEVDGVDGESYVRDLQFKTFTPVVSISGENNASRFPWSFGEPYTSINKKYLSLRASLTPYLYSLAYQATHTGVPIVRPIFLEFPDDVGSLNATNQFMFGSEYLVVPVGVQGSVTVDGIYLPSGVWVDFWSNTKYSGPAKLGSYHAPLDTIPLFVKSGSIIPQYASVPQGGQKPAPDSPLVINVYPPQTGHISTFTLYSDDRTSIAHQKSSAYATQLITADNSAADRLVIIINPVTGSYPSQPPTRAFTVAVHLAAVAPQTLAAASLPYTLDAAGIATFVLPRALLPDQDATIELFWTASAAPSKVNVVGAVLVSIIILGALVVMLLFDKAREHAAAAPPPLRDGTAVAAANGVGGGGGSGGAAAAAAKGNGYPEIREDDAAYTQLKSYWQQLLGPSRQVLLKFVKKDNVKHYFVA
ncbi:hypothetical protein HDU84_005241 [Entophlyctis sp. JEL0112]|nr:hypothetical protein HDU84_005241 [Entophlyctis sp. JEL0112]